MMAKRLSKQEVRYLLIAHARLSDPTNEFGIFPDSQWFEDRLFIGSQGVTNIKRRLKRKGYLEISDYGETVLSDSALAFVSQRQTRAERSPVEIITPGQVSAGDRSAGELRVNASDISDYITDTIPVIGMEYVDKPVVAYEVVGNSMEEEEIFPGNYVIVEVNPNKAYDTNRIIVTKYLGMDDDSSSLKGPTLKANKGRGKDPRGRPCHVLGWTGKNYKHNPYTIYARHIEPIGVVIGVFSPLPKPKSR